MTAKTGTCAKKKKFYGIITLTEKGQLAIPVELRRELSLNQGDKLMVIKRTDGTGLNLIKADAIDDFIEKIANN